MHHHNSQHHLLHHHHQYHQSMDLLVDRATIGEASESDTIILDDHENTADTRTEISCPNKNIIKPHFHDKEDDGVV